MDPAKMEGKDGRPLNLDQLFMKVTVSSNVKNTLLDDHKKVL